MRFVSRMVVAALLATTIQLVAGAPAQAAPVSCTGTAKVFDGRSDGTLWYYEHRAPATGDASWTVGRQIGSGFGGLTAASTNGTIYFVNRAGELRRYRYDGTRWTDGAGTVVGTGWQDVSYLSGRRITVDAQGRLFAADGTGVLRVFDQTVPRWDLDKGIPLDVGWFNAPFAAGDNVFYRHEVDGMYRYRYDPAAQRLIRSTNRVGAGFGAFDVIFSPGGDVLYAIGGNNLYWYRYDVDTGTWANGGAGRLVGSGWAGRITVSATSNTCSVPAPAPVGAVTPEPVNPVRAYQPAGRSDRFRFMFTGVDRKPYHADGEPWVPRLMSGDRTFASDLSSTSGDNGREMAVAGIDGTGQVWLSQDRTFLGNWVPFGQGLSKIEFTRPVFWAALVAVATNPDGRLWWRSQQRSGEGYRWTAWRQIFAGERGFHDVAHTGFAKTYGVTAQGDRWFLANREPQFGPEFRTGQVPAAADFDLPAVADNGDRTMALFARHRATGQPHVLHGNADWTGFSSTWTPLPPLTEDGSVTLSQVPMSAVELRGRLAVAAVGTDGHVYVTNQNLATLAFHPWQRLGEPAANAPALTVPTALEAHLVFLGRDGKRYVYVDNRQTASGPLVFTGGGWA